MLTFKNAASPYGKEVGVLKLPPSLNGLVAVVL